MRIGTINTENLFSRAKVFNFRNNADGDKILKQIADLQTELGKPVYKGSLPLLLQRMRLQIMRLCGQILKYSNYKLLQYS